MNVPEIVTASCLVLLGFAHSILGESAIVKPLFSAKWKIETPRWAAERILRFAWHLTSIAWFAIAAVITGASVLPTVGVMSITSAMLIFVMLRGHLAWPLFLLAGLAAFRAEGWIDGPLPQIGAGATAAALVAAAAIHLYWALGGKWMLDTASPKVEGRDFSPGPILTLAVAIALATFATLVALASFTDPPNVVRWLVVVGIVAFTIRAIGDNKIVGFTKQDHASDFGRADDRYFTPLIVFLALGATAALLS